MKKLIIIAAALTLTSASAVALSKAFANHTHEEGNWNHGPIPTGHSGGLDKNGGHYDHKNGGYHFHR